MTVDLTAINAGLTSARAKVAGTIRNAATTTGTSFQYLLATAKMESNLDPSAAATTSSARGLYQFIDQTWLATVKESGASLGYGKYADAITKSPSGQYSVSDPAARTAILNLRDDPAANAAMAGVLTQSNSFELTGKIGRRPTDGELYMAHFMGVGGAARLISNAEDNPNASGTALFPNAAAANHSIFYDSSGSARTVSQVYSVLSARYAAAANSSTTRVAMAAAGAAPGGAAIAAAPVDNAAYLSSFPNVNAATSANAPTTVNASGNAVTTGQSSSGVASTAQSTPMFRTLFHAGDRAEPLSPVVQELWGNSGGLHSPGAPTATPNVAAPAGLDLFSDRTGAFS